MIDVEFYVIYVRRYLNVKDIEIYQIGITNTISITFNFKALVKSVGTKCKKRIQVNANHFLTKLSKEKVYRYHADFFVTDREIPQRNKDG